ncbi:unnamed protein product [Kuraishia capsulata CBS 1993]|uniref:RRM domain-containing protein n=1 Tax=Kuraishia capsulata CBS 1993 TaxID=1382522 RepID=W6MR61_9ASCO|nr:uncharacterized protein KUCA_T00005194001 [Kuraishia capsulata CBS 1993]CDK29206.1 unnamed protein product [Kuraishia capsulata CBS 1993]
MSETESATQTDQVVPPAVQEQAAGTGTLEEPATTTDAGTTSTELAALQSQMAEMEQEAAKLRELQQQQEDQQQELIDKEEVDSKSIYVGNVDYDSTPEELQKHFQACGSINRVTILTDKFTGNPKGFAYIEFSDPAYVTEALNLNDSLFRGRNLKVTAKRTNIPGFARGRGRGGFRARGRGRGRGGFRGGFRGGSRGRARFNPY